MSITSIEFLLFVSFCVGLYYLINVKFRQIYLLFISIIFYSLFDWKYTLILIFVIIKDFIASQIFITYKCFKKTVITVNISLSILTLITFKYFDFFLVNVNKLFDIKIFHPIYSFIIPVGLSFYILKSISYNIEIYRNNISIENNIFYYALYLSFFPSILSGPIDRPNKLLPQFRKSHKFNYYLFSSGLLLMVWGYFQKLVISNRIAPIVNQVFNNPDFYYGLNIIIAAILYSFQIFTDFSGYSDIAIGLAMMFGYNLMTNFNKPYFSVSIHEFWSRWHISLSTWLRDYIFLPLAYKTTRILSRYSINIRHNQIISYSIAIIITMLLAGIWHGNDINFIIWGFGYSIVMILTRLFQKKSKKSKNAFIKILNILKIFFVVTLLWIPFRASNYDELLVIINNTFKYQTFNYYFVNYDFIILIISLSILIIIEIYRKDDLFFDFWKQKNVYFRWIFYYLLIFFTLYLGKYGEKSFIYFKF